MANLSALFEKYDRLVLFDTETTGLLYNRDEIIEFAAVVVEQVNGIPTVVREYDELVSLSPGGFVPPKIEQLTGISTMDIRERGGDSRDPGVFFCVGGDYQQRYQLLLCFLQRYRQIRPVLLRCHLRPFRVPLCLEKRVLISTPGSQYPAHHQRYGCKHLLHTHHSTCFSPP